MIQYNKILGSKIQQNLVNMFSSSFDQLNVGFDNLDMQI